MPPVAARRRSGWGRWCWGLSGVATIAALGIPGAWLITRAGFPAGSPPSQSVVASRPVTITQPVTSVRVESYGAQIRVMAGSVRGARVRETIMFSPPDARPAITTSVSGGRLTLAAPGCDVSGCSVSFTVTVPADATVDATSDGGAITVSGIAGAKLDSGDGPVRATRIHGPLTVRTDGAPLIVDGLAGPLHADTGGGPLLARDVTAPTAMITTDGADADIEFTAAPGTVTVDSGGGGTQLGFTAPPGAVTVNTDGGLALLTVPGGPYAVTANSDGGPEVIGIPTDPAARRLLAVTSGGGPLQIEPATGPMAMLPARSVPSARPVRPVRHVPPVRPVPPVPPRPVSAA